MISLPHGVKAYMANDLNKTRELLCAPAQEKRPTLLMGGYNSGPRW